MQNNFPASIFSHLKLRDNWPVLFLIVLFIYVKYAARNLCLPFYIQQTDTIIDYNALLSEYDFQHSNVGIYIIFFVLNVIAVAIIFRAKRKIVLIPSLIFFDLYMGLIFFVSMSCMQTRLTHVATTEFSNRTYHLTVDYTRYDDYSVRSYLVFECVSSSVACHLFREVVAYPADYDFPGAAFVVDPADKSLYVEVDDPKIPKKLIASPA